MDKTTIKESTDYFLHNVCPLASVTLLFGYTILSALNALPSYFSSMSGNASIFLTSSGLNHSL
jgi:hypothetical protein